MIWKTGSFLFCTIFLIIAGACSRNPPPAEIVVEIPSGFSGNFLLEMGIKEAAPLDKSGGGFILTVPKSGKASTSTLVTNPRITFKNASSGAVWGYSRSIFTTGDGIPVSGKIEFFVGSREEYEAEQGKKNHSRGFSAYTEFTGADA